MSQEQVKQNRILSVRVVDASFESPNKLALAGRNEVPQITQKQEGPVVTRVNEEGVYTVQLSLNVSCDYEDKTNIFIAEVKGVATVVINEEDELAAKVLLEGTVVDVLYNHLRFSVNDLIVAGGFPEFHAQFLSYEQRFLLENQELLQKAQEAAAQ